MDQIERGEFIRDMRRSRALQRQTVEHIPAPPPTEDRMDRWRREGAAAAHARAVEKENIATQTRAIAEQHHRVAAVESEVALLLQAVADLFELVEGLERRVVAPPAPSITASSTADIPDFLPRRRGPDGVRYTQPLVTVRRNGR
jgi:hypothetical protein